MRVVILGAGGLGCVIGACLVEAGVDVSLIARQQHVDAIHRDGLQIAGTRGDRTVRLHAVADAREIDGSIDYLILLTKTRDTDAALDSAAVLRDRTAVARSWPDSRRRHSASAKGRRSRTASPPAAELSTTSRSPRSCSPCTAPWASNRAISSRPSRSSAPWPARRSKRRSTTRLPSAPRWW